MAFEGLPRAGSSFTWYLLPLLLDPEGIFLSKIPSPAQHAGFPVASRAENEGGYVPKMSGEQWVEKIDVG